jgi:hypothetical protein
MAPLPNAPLALRGRAAVHGLPHACGRSLAGLLALAALVTACRSGGPSSAVRPASGTPLCFEQLSGAPGSQSIEQLRLDPRADQITGFYRWIPWQKDRRIGTLSGRIASPGKARVGYRYSQEGRQAIAPLTIAFDADRAVIRWDQPQQPMSPVELPARACAELKAVPGL